MFPALVLEPGVTEPGEVERPHLAPAAPSVAP
jgi:hypothetical protein